MRERLGSAEIFKDIDSLTPGDEFPERIRDAVGSCEVLLALIGDQWATITDGSGARGDPPRHPGGTADPPRPPEQMSLGSARRWVLSRLLPPPARRRPG